MDIKAMIFDKDGTLIDFDAFWVSVSEKALDMLLSDIDMKNVPVERILSAFGIKDGVTDIDGVLCKGTYEEMGEIVYDILREYGSVYEREDIVGRVLSAYNAASDLGEVKPTYDGIFELLSEFKTKGIRLAVVTTDNELITRKCLKALGIEELFDRIYTDDGKTPTKPDPYCALDLSERFGILKSEMIMVGDTMTDVRFARNAGIYALSLAKDEKTRERLSPFADRVISSLDELRALVE